MDDFTHLFNESIDLIILEYNKKENKDKVEKNILDPIVMYLGHQLWPYILTVSILLCLMFVILFYLIYKMSHVKSSLSSMNA